MGLRPSPQAASDFVAAVVWMIKSVGDLPMEERTPDGLLSLLDAAGQLLAQRPGSSLSHDGDLRMLVATVRRAVEDDPSRGSDRS